MAGKQFLRNITSRLCRYSGGQKFFRNHSNSHRFRDNYVFAFSAEIQDGRTKISYITWENRSHTKMIPRTIYKTFLQNEVLGMLLSYDLQRKITEQI